ncbi:MAG: hypothetical protein ACLR7Z_11265 [Bilophila wadsworthia]
MWLAACEAPAQDTEAFDTFMSEAATLEANPPTASIWHGPLTANLPP